MYYTLFPKPLWKTNFVWSVSNKIILDFIVSNKLFASRLILDVSLILPTISEIIKSITLLSLVSTSSFLKSISLRESDSNKICHDFSCRSYLDTWISPLNKKHLRENLPDTPQKIIVIPKIYKKGFIPEENTAIARS